MIYILIPAVYCKLICNIYIIYAPGPWARAPRALWLLFDPRGSNAFCHSPVSDDTPPPPSLSWQLGEPIIHSFIHSFTSKFCVDGHIYLHLVIWCDIHISRQILRCIFESRPSTYLLSGTWADRIRDGVPTGTHWTGPYVPVAARRNVLWWE